MSHPLIDYLPLLAEWEDRRHLAAAVAKAQREYTLREVAAWLRRQSSTGLFFATQLEVEVIDEMAKR